MKSSFGLHIEQWLQTLNINAEVSVYISALIQVVILAFVAYLSYIITKNYLLKILGRIISKSKSQWDDILFKKKVFNRLAYIVPAIIVQYLIVYFLSDFPKLSGFLEKGISIYIIFISIRAIDAFLNGMHEIYLTLPSSKDKPIKSYIQIIIILVYFIGVIIVLSIVLDKKVATFFAGLGAMAAVLMLVFKDTLLGLVGGVQLSANDMVRPGDWIEMPSRKADGTVIEISLHTVKVQNWDKTITTIPTYAMVNESFVNWRGMEQSAGRRIKRSINIDMTSVKFCDNKLIEKLQKIKILQPYIKSKLEELENYNKKHDIDETVKVNGRRMTNLGTFRKYIEQYLHNHPKINKEMTFLVRQLQPLETGIPIEIYVFSSEKTWAVYESIQADIFDHILAVTPEFELRVFQNPSGHDMRTLSEKI